MDPDATLARIRVLTAKVLSAGIDNPDALGDDLWRDHWGELEGPAAALDELAELVNSLDEWISKGGFLPHGWRTS